MSSALSLNKDNERVLQGDAACFYNYLKKQVLSCKENVEQLRERVREVYYDMVSEINRPYEYSSFPIMNVPSVEHISGQINDENMSAIELSCSENGFSLHDCDEILSIYCHEIGCVIDDFVAEILWEYNFPTVNVNIYTRNKLLNLCPCDTAQLRMDYEKEWI